MNSDHRALTSMSTFLTLIAVIQFLTLIAVIQLLQHNGNYYFQSKIARNEKTELAIIKNVKHFSISDDISNNSRSGQVFDTCSWSTVKRSTSEIKTSCPKTSAWFATRLPNYMCGLKTEELHNSSYVSRNELSCKLRGDIPKKTFEEQYGVIMLVGDSHMYNMFAEVLCLREELGYEWVDPLSPMEGFIRQGNIMYFSSWFLWLDTKYKEYFLAAKKREESESHDHYVRMMVSDMLWAEQALELGTSLRLLILNSGAHWNVNHLGPENIPELFERMIDRLSSSLLPALQSKGTSIIYVETAQPGCAVEDIGKDTWSWDLFDPENIYARKAMTRIGVFVFPLWSFAQNTFLNHPKNRGVNDIDCAHYCILEKDSVPSLVMRYILINLDSLVK